MTLHRRTYDKLIATIPARQSTGGLRLSFGFISARHAGSTQAHRHAVLQSSR